MEAREFARARAALDPLAADRPSMRVCLLLSDLEQAEHGATGKGREWLFRATRAPRDPVWMADGVVSDHWAPVSPVTGRIDAFVWQAPPDVLVAPELTVTDEVTADLDDRTTTVSIPAPVPTPSPTPSPTPPPAPVVEPEPEVPAAIRISVDPTPASLPQDAAEPAPVALAPVPIQVVEGASKPVSNGAAAPEPTPVVFPVDHSPDDPGTEPGEAKPLRRGLFS